MGLLHKARLLRRDAERVEACSAMIPAVKKAPTLEAMTERSVSPLARIFVEFDPKSEFLLNAASECESLARFLLFNVV